MSIHRGDSAESVFLLSLLGGGGAGAGCALPQQQLPRGLHKGRHGRWLSTSVSRARTSVSRAPCPTIAGEPAQGEDKRGSGHEAQHSSLHLAFPPPCRVSDAPLSAPLGDGKRWAAPHAQRKSGSWSTVTSTPRRPDVCTPRAPEQGVVGKRDALCACAGALPPKKYGLATP